MSGNGWAMWLLLCMYCFVLAWQPDARRHGWACGYCSAQRRQMRGRSR